MADDVARRGYTWGCDYCSAPFPTFEAASHHESTCPARSHAPNPQDGYDSSIAVERDMVDEILAPQVENIDLARVNESNGNAE